MALCVLLEKIGSLWGLYSSAPPAGCPLVEEMMFHAKRSRLLQKGAQAHHPQKVRLIKKIEYRQPEFARWVDKRISWEAFQGQNSLLLLDVQEKIL